MGDVLEGSCAHAAEQASWHSADDSCSEKVVEIAVVVSVARICAIEVVSEGAVGVESALTDGVGEYRVRCPVIWAEEELFVFGVGQEENGEVVETLGCGKVKCVGVEPEDGRGGVVVIAEIDLACSADLLDVTEGCCFFGGILGLSKDREQDCGEDCYDSDDDEKLDERECTLHKVIFGDAKLSSVDGFGGGLSVLTEIIQLRVDFDCNDRSKLTDLMVNCSGDDR